LRLTFLDVSTAGTPGELAGWGIDAPRPGDERDRYSFEVRGWALGRRTPVVAVELLHDDVVQWRAPLGETRADVAEAHPESPEARFCGFRTDATAVALPAEFELGVRFVLEDKTRLPVGRIHGARDQIAATSDARLQPIIVTTIGRSGSTAVVDVLSRHPEVIAYRPRETEARTATYWAGVLRELAEPASYNGQLGRVGTEREPWWLRGQNPSVDEILAERAWESAGERGERPASTDTGADGLGRWVEMHGLGSLASLAKGRIDGLYGRIADHQGRAEARYFAEKYIPNFVPDLVWELYPKAREIVLVRDFRDLVASIFAYNAKRGFVGFGRDRADSDLNYVLTTERRSVTALARSWRRRQSRAHLLRYEDLVTQPEETVEELAAYIGLESSRGDMLEPLARSAEMEAHRTSASPLRSIGRWRDDLSADLQEACDEAFGDALRLFGYDSSRRTAGSDWARERS
jgi:hypothetical protein